MNLTSNSTPTNQLLTIEQLQQLVERQTGMKCKIILLDKFEALLQQLSLDQLNEVFEQSCSHLRWKQENKDEKNLLTIFSLMAEKSGHSLINIGAFFALTLTKMIYIIERGKHQLSTDSEFFEFYTAMQSEIMEYWG